jgi:hypothetical protein
MRAALFAIMVASALAQPGVDIRHESGVFPDTLREAEGRWLKAHGTWRNATSPEDRAVTAAIATTFNEYFQPQLDMPSGIETLTESGKDILVARWTASREMTIFSEMIAWDTPDRTTFLFRLHHGVWSSNSAIQSFFERLLRAPRADRRIPVIKSVQLNVGVDPNGQRRIGSGALVLNTIPRQFARGPDASFYLWDAKDASYLSMTLQEYITLDYPADMRRIGERFPPLTERAKQWSKQRLIDELTPGGFDAMDRDRILTAELLTRNVADDELLALLKRRKPDFSGAVIIGIVDLDQVYRFSAPIREYLRTVVDPIRLDNNPFKELNRISEPNFTDAAIDALHKNVHATPAFQYAANHGTTIAEYESLAALPPLPEQVSYLEQMRRRLGIPNR